MGGHPLTSPLVLYRHRWSSQVTESGGFTSSSAWPESPPPSWSAGRAHPAMARRRTAPLWADPDLQKQPEDKEETRWPRWAPGPTTVFYLPLLAECGTTDEGEAKESQRTLNRFNKTDQIIYVKNVNYSDKHLLTEQENTFQDNKTKSKVKAKAKAITLLKAHLLPFCIVCQSNPENCLYTAWAPPHLQLSPWKPEQLQQES